MHTFEDAKKKAMNMLAARSYCGMELADKLRQSGFDEAVVDSVMEWAREYRFVDDAAYARRYIDTALAKHHGRRRIARDLLAKGIDAYTVEDVFAEYEQDEAETLRPLMEKKLGGDFSPKNRAKASRYFAARGYSFSDISDTIRRICDEFDENNF